MHVNTALVISFLVGSVLPLVVGLVSKTNWHPGARAVLLLALSAASSLLSQFAEFGAGPGFDWAAALFGVLTTFVAGVVAHFGLWQPTTVSARLLAVGSGPETQRPGAKAV